MSLKQFTFVRGLDGHVLSGFDAVDVRAEGSSVHGVVKKVVDIDAVTLCLLSHFAHHRLVLKSAFKGTVPSVVRFDLSMRILGAIDFGGGSSTDLCLGRESEEWANLDNLILLNILKLMAHVVVGRI